MSDDASQKSDTAKREEEVLAFWKENNIFEKSLKKESPKGEYVFYDGPPFATGTPHYGHLVASAIKDVVPRYFTMRGYHVERQWGWDCHGLPIENIVEKELGTKSKKDIEEIGVKKFNDLCREKIFTYVDEWNTFIPRFGRWADMENPYRTMDKDFMESEWWAFKTLYDKGLIYEDYRSMHICPRCETTLAQSEVAEGYRDIKDWAVTVKFELKGDPGTYLLAWTTTPWTLPGNVALAVNLNEDYALVDMDRQAKEMKGKVVLAVGSMILLEEKIEKKDPSKPFEIDALIKGSELIGKEYHPPFDSYVDDSSVINKENGWKVYAADFVTTDTGTGIAHEAPAFGADDLKLAQEVGLPVIQHVGMDGIIKPEVKELAGLSVKPIDDHQKTDVEVIKYLAGKGLLFAKEKYEHSYPHCWRCDTPLINYATTSWFVAVQKIKDDLLKYAEEINWSPAHVKEGRWGDWLLGARDWSISRQRFWANTIPVWRCDKCKKDRVFGSAQELSVASGTEVTDLHKEIVDEITVPCECGGEMKRIPDVLDTWFNSGSVPFASYHFPFENKEKVSERIPADFIAEGQDQVSKWFYYQHVLAGGLFKKNAFKNVVVNGIVLAEDGKKMSKRLQNYPDPKIIVDQYGADAVRLYLLSSPVVRAENLNFSEGGVAQMSSKIVGRLENCYSLYELYKNDVPHEADGTSSQILDKWIVARLREVTRTVTTGMDSYEIDRATREFVDFVNDFSTWYIRRSRGRFKGDDERDKKLALQTTLFVLKELARVIAPFAPFIADFLWQKLRTDEDVESVHLASWPEEDGDTDHDLIVEMIRARRYVSQALELRAKDGKNVRQPLSSLAIGVGFMHEGIRELIKDEVNVKDVLIGTSEAAVEIELDTTITPELAREGVYRGWLRMVQDARKKAGLQAGQEAKAVIVADLESQDILKENEEELKKVAHLSSVEYKEGDLSVSVQ